MSKKPETIIEDKYCEFIAELKTVVALKLVLLELMGWPDRTVLHNGRVFFIEFKLPGEDLSPQQKKWKKILTGLGFKYYICYTTFQAIEITKYEMESILND